MVDQHNTEQIGLKIPPIIPGFFKVF